MDPVSWIVVGGVIVLAAVGVGVWNRFGKGRPPIGDLDRDGQGEVEKADAAKNRLGGPPGGDAGGGLL